MYISCTESPQWEQDVQRDSSVCLEAHAVSKKRSLWYRCTVEQYLLLVFTIFEVLEVTVHGVNELETAIKSTINHAKTSFSTEICAGAIVIVA
jgi:hypothetical protein